MDVIDTAVIGAGVVGLACARALANAGREVWVLEAADAIGQGVSSRNSEVIHAGIYYPSGSLKARLCVRGKELLYAYAAERGVGHSRCGKLIVAGTPEQEAELEGIAARAAANGVTDLQALGGAQARALEPQLHCRAALLSPSTGIVDSHGLMLALQGDLEAAGGQVVLRARVDGGACQADGIVLHVALPDGERMALKARQVVNAASLHAPDLARHLVGLDPRALPTASYAKGSYFSLAGRAPFSRLIYPAPQDAWLGVHFTLDLGGQAKFGPDLQWLDVASPEAIDYRVDPARGESFYAEVRRYWPGLPDGALQPAYSGVRPKIHPRGTPAPDFRIDGPADHGVPGLINLLGIESPGLTSSLALGEEVLRRLAEG